MRTRNPDFEVGTLNPYVVEGDEIKPGDLYGYKVVVVIQQDGTYCGYRGPTTWPDVRVKNFGDSVSEEAVKFLFPTIWKVMKARKIPYSS
jgi:hypothetical protein